jgi:hypothetical protein
VGSAEGLAVADGTTVGLGIGVGVGVGVSVGRGAAVAEAVCNSGDGVRSALADEATVVHDTTTPSDRVSRAYGKLARALRAGDHGFT